MNFVCATSSVADPEGGGSHVKRSHKKDGRQIRTYFMFLAPPQTQPMDPMLSCQEIQNRTHGKISLHWTKLIMFVLSLAFQPQELESQSHNFRNKSFKKPRNCAVCNQLVWNSGSVCRGLCPITSTIKYFSVYLVKKSMTINVNKNAFQWDTYRPLQWRSRGEGVSAHRGVCWGVGCLPGGGVSAWGGYLPRGCLSRGCVCPGGCLPDTSSRGQNDRQV